jgi:DNA-directed RNA polymerase subunit F
MSRELLDEYLEKIDEDEDLGEIIEGLVEYGFADENDLCKALDISPEALDELVSSTYSWDEKADKRLRRLLTNHLKKVRKSYERLYYSSKNKN